MGGWVVGRGSCLLEDKKKKKIYISSVSARSKFAIVRSRINFPEHLLRNVEQRKTAAGIFCRLQVAGCRLQVAG